MTGQKSEPADPAAGTPRRFFVPAVFLCVFTLMGCLYAVYIPAWHPYDEPFHFLYVQKILRDGEVPAREKNYQAVHSPFYYTICAAASIPVRNRSYVFQMRYLRILNVLFGTLSLWLLYRTALAAGCARRTALAALALGASVPMLTVDFASVNNDNFAVLFAWISMYVFCAQARNGIGAKGAALAGLCVGLACAAKSINAFIVPLYAIVYLCFSRPLSLRNMVRDAAAFLALFIPLGFAWQLYQFHLHGNLVFGNPVSEHFEQFAFWQPHNFAVWLRVFFGTFWMFVEFLRNHVEPRPGIGYYYFFLCATLVFLAGMAATLFRPGNAPPWQRRLKWIFVAGFALTVTELLMISWSGMRAAARYTFPALSGMLILWALGIESLLRKHAALACFLFFAAVQILNFIFIFLYIRHTPAMPFSITPAML